MIETWTVDGTLLNRMAYNIETFTGRSSTPPVRGDNVRIPYREGSLWQPKMFDENKVLLSMFILGCNPDGTMPTTHSRRAQFNKNLEQLQKLFAVRHRELSIVKVKDMPDGPLTLTGSAGCDETTDPTTMAGGTRGVMTATLTMADPFWYAPTATHIVTSAGLTAENSGTTIAKDMTITLTGPLLNPALTNTTLGIALRYSGELTGGQTVVLDTDAFTAVEGTSNRIGNVTHSGSDRWMALLDGANEMTLTNWQGGSVGAGTATISYNPPHFN